MDVGIFKASKVRLVMWIVIPPLLIVSVGLSSYAFEQRAEWKLKETRALSDVLPEVVDAKRDVKELYDSLGLSETKRISSGDQLVSILEVEARKHRIELKRTQIMERDTSKSSKIPIISVIMDASGNFTDFQLLLNDIKSAHPLVSTRSITIDQGDAGEELTEFDIKVVLDLLLVGDVLKSSGELL